MTARLGSLPQRLISSGLSCAVSSERTFSAWPPSKLLRAPGGGGPDPGCRRNGLPHDAVAVA